MAQQFSVEVRNAMLEAIELTANGQTLQAGAVTGTAAAPKLRIYTGAAPANTAAAATGTLLVDIALPADWAANAAAGSKALAGTWQGTAAAAGTAGYYRIVNNGATVAHEQGTCGQQVSLTTSAATAANGNTLTFTATTGVVTGMNVSGTGIPVGATVVAVTATTVTLSMTSTAGVAITTAITFTYDMTLDNASIASGQTITVSAKTLNAPNA